MKKGDVVKIDDSSYSLTMVGDHLEHHPGEVQKEHWIVIAVNCSLPAETDQYSMNQRNNAIVQSRTSGKIAFVQQRFCHLVLPKHKVMIDIEQISYAICGNVIEISDKLYKEIKRDSQS